MKIIFALFLFVFGTNVHAITVKGTSEYKSQVNECLNLLSSKTESDYMFIKKYIGIIQQSNKSGMKAWENPPRYFMSDKTAFYSLTWCASTIAHDSYHSYLYQKNKSKYGGRPQYKKWGGFEAEKEAIKYQEKIMRIIGSSDHEINYIKTLDVTHGDTNNDGKLDSTDYKQRTW